MSALAASDPFHIAGVATYSVCEVQIVMARPGLELLLAAGAA
jgi:hypothetical protein